MPYLTKQKTILLLPSNQDVNYINPLLVFQHIELT